MDSALIKAFWRCGDNDIIEFAMMRARLNRSERDAIRLTLDECLSQEESAESMNVSTRRFQDFWYSAVDKLLAIPWVRAYAIELKGHNAG